MFDYYSYIEEIKNEETVKKPHYYCMKLISLICPMGAIYIGVKELPIMIGYC